MIFSVMSGNKKIHINESQWGDILNPIVTYDNMLGLFETLNEGKKVLYEGLIKSYSADVVSRYVMRYFSDDMVKARVRNRNGVEIVEVFIPKDERYLEAVKNVMEYPCGYTLARVGTRDDIQQMKLFFEPKFQKSINGEISEHETLIHVSPYYNRDKIMKYGFSPKFKNDMFNYEGRIYFFSTLSKIENILALSTDIALAKDSEKTKNVFDFYYVSPQELIKNGKAEFHRDSMTFDAIAYWTYDNIPPTCITNVKRFICHGSSKEWELLENKIVTI